MTTSARGSTKPARGLGEESRLGNGHQPRRSHLPEAAEKKAIALMLKQPSMIKRPVLELPGGKLLVGFRPEEYAASLK
jgi:arsenate reductase-like glutaredoxin family protein